MTLRLHETTGANEGKALEGSRGIRPAVDGTDASGKLFSLALSHLVPRALHVVAEMRIADQLADEPRTAAQLGAALGTAVVPGRLHRLLRLLAANGVFRQEDEDHFSHTELSLLLRSDHPRSMRDFILVADGPGRWQAIGQLVHTVRTGETGMRSAFGMELFDYNEQNPVEGAAFDRSMRAKSHSDVAAVQKAYDFRASELVVDVGGGDGYLLSAILKQSGGRGLLFELPNVASRVQGTDQPFFEVIAGDFFRDALPAGDVYLLMQVLHDWEDDDAVRILSAVRNAARPTSKLLLIELLFPEDGAPHPARALDVMMMIITGGRERTRLEYARLMERAGWKFERVVRTAGPISILEAMAG